MARHIYFLAKPNKIFVLVASSPAGVDWHIINMSASMVFWKKLPELGLCNHGLSSEGVVCLKGFLQRSVELIVLLRNQMPAGRPADTICFHKVIEHECT